MLRSIRFDGSRPDDDESFVLVEGAHKAKHNRSPTEFVKVSKRNKRIATTQRVGGHILIKREISELSLFTMTMKPTLAALATLLFICLSIYPGQAFTTITSVNPNYRRRISSAHHNDIIVSQSSLPSTSRFLANISGESSSAQHPPPPPVFVPKPLPVLLGGGLFLFANSVNRQYKAFAQELLKQSEAAMRSDAMVSMELGQGVEAGGIYASKYARAPGDIDQLVVQFQIEGGNAWAQGVAYGIRTTGNNIQLVSLEVANMDASMKGTPFEINIPMPNNNDDSHGVAES